MDQMSETQKIRLQAALAVVRDNPSKFEPKFASWLESNWRIFEEFERMSDLLRGKGIKHYGAKSIWETIRFHTTLSEVASKFKLNNNWHAPCARLYVLINPERSGFFDFRSRPALRNHQRKYFDHPAHPAMA